MYAIKVEYRDTDKVFGPFAYSELYKVTTDLIADYSILAWGLFVIATKQEIHRWTSYAENLYRLKLTDEDLKTVKSL